MQIFFLEIDHDDFADLSGGIERVVQFPRSNEDQISGLQLVDRIFEQEATASRPEIKNFIKAVIMIGLQGRKITSAAFFHDDPVNILSAASAFLVVISIAAPSLF